MNERFQGFYPGYDVLAKWDSPSWNDITRRVVGERLAAVPGRSFLNPEEWRLLEAVCDRLVPQPERSQPIPIVPWIDRKLARNQGDGYRYADLPPQRQAWRQGLAALADESRRQTGQDFEALPPERQDALLRAVQEGRTASPGWGGMKPQRFFTTVLLNEVVAVYYSHPAAWSEIGFGGPASPRGYVRMDANRADPWEAGPATHHPRREQRR